MDQTGMEAGRRCARRIILDIQPGYSMRDAPHLDPILRRRMRYAEGKLRTAQLRQSRTERSILYWTRILADLRHERTRAIQPPLWPEETSEENQADAG
jgi:hypothetical protein